MKLSQLKKTLDAVSELNFIQTNGHFVPRHFHITEAGLTTKNFIDCGGVLRTENYVSFQIWVADDYNHRLTPNKFAQIIEMANPLFANGDPEVEVEYQDDSISRYGLDFNGHQFQFTSKQTNCLAPDRCGIPAEKTKVKLSDISTTKNCCTPGEGCC